MSSARSLALAILFASCAREVRLEIHHPASCCPTGEPCPADACPLDGIEAFRTSLVRLGGTSELEICTPVRDEPLCGWEDLQDFVFLDTIARDRPSDATEIVIEGLGARGCGENPDLVLLCDSLGDTAADLEDDAVVRMWCGCPFE